MLKEIWKELSKLLKDDPEARGFIILIFSVFVGYGVLWFLGFTGG